jgi:hypothetical protein
LQKTKVSVEEFINAVDHEGKRKDAFEILEMIQEGYKRGHVGIE